VYTLSGHVLKTTKLESKAVTDPGAFFADALRTRMTAAGITVDRIVHAGSPLGDSEVPAEDKVVAVHETPYIDIQNRICRNSQNLFAECADKALGKAYCTLKGDPGPGTWEKGEAAVKAFLRSYHVDDKAFRIVDGSGLSREDRVTARGITELLAAMYRHRYATAFRESLAQPGKDGTLGKGRLEELKGRVWAKTGYIGGVRSLSGYVHTKHGKWLAFSFIYNEIPGSVKRYEALQDDAVRLLYKDDRDAFNW
jgi:D-alanyl-D-alanine carboxypeptidase/D-alanyl-D-alanine-endopeptidase (penicillin-binding protein 4)